MAPFSTNGQSDISTDISPNLDNAIRKVIVLPGVIENDHPLYKDQVIVEYSGFFETGECFTTKQKYSFCIGTGDVIQAWNICVSTMFIGEIALFHCTSDYAYGVAGLPPLIPPSTNIIFEIELVSFKGEDLTKNRDEGVLLSIISASISKDKPLFGANCKVNIVGWCVKNKEFMNLIDYEFVLDESSDIIPALEKAIKKSGVGQKSLIKIIPKYGYKQTSTQNFLKTDVLYDNSIQYYELTLISFKQTKQHWEMTQTELLENAKQFKDRGSDLFKNGKWEDAGHKYKRSLLLLEAVHDSDDKDAQETRNELRIVTHLNLSLCHLKLGNYLRAFNEADIVLQLKPNDIKALYRRGLAHYNLSNYDEAMDDFICVLKIEPKNKEAIIQYKECRKKIEEDKSKKKAVFCGMFKKFNEFDQKLEPSSVNGDVFYEIGNWNNEMASGMISLEQEMEAFKFDDDDDDIDNSVLNDDEDDEQFCV